MAKHISQFVLPVEKSCFNEQAVLPYGLKNEHINYAMNDFCSFLSFVNTEFHKNNMLILEKILMQAIFSSIVGEFINTTIPKYCNTLTINKYHNGHPDLIEKGKFSNDSIQHFHDGIEIKASRYEKGWQGHNPENIWLMVFVFDCMRRVHTPPLWGDIKGMYPETNTLPKQPYPVRSAAGLVDCSCTNDTIPYKPFHFKAVYGAKLEESDWQFAGRKEGSRRTITAAVKNSGFEKMNTNWIYKFQSNNFSP